MSRLNTEMPMQDLGLDLERLQFGRLLVHVGVHELADAALDRVLEAGDKRLLDLDAGLGEAQESVRPHGAAGALDADCLRRKQETGYHLKAGAPAASTNGFPTASRPLAAGGRLLLDRSAKKHEFMAPKK